MTRYWVIAPFSAEMPEIWDRVWEFDLQHSLISIGWKQLGDFTALNEDALFAAIDKTYPDYPLQKKTLTLNMLWSFYHSIEPGDIIIARRGRKRIAAIGSALGHAYYSLAKNVDASGPDHAYSNHIDVRWHDAPRDKVFPNIVFGMQTVYEISEDLYRELSGVEPSTAIEPVEEGVQDQTEFVLERYLEDFIVTNFQAIFGGDLVLYHDPKENVVGQQYATDIGRIDILAQEPDTDAFVVIELKKGRESDKVVGQTLRYMGWVSDNLCSQGQPVRGIIVCRDTDPKLSFAARMTNIAVKHYKIDFKLEDDPSTESRKTAH